MLRSMSADCSQREQVFDGYVKINLTNQNHLIALARSCVIDTAQRLRPVERAATCRACSAAGESEGGVPSLTLVSQRTAWGDAHCPQRLGGFRPSRMMPSGPAMGMEPSVVFASSEWHDHSARRSGLAAPDAPSGGGEARVSVQPFNDALLERLDLGLKARPAAVMLQKACTFVEARSPVFSIPIRTARAAQACPSWENSARNGLMLSIFRRFSRFSAALSRPRLFAGEVVRYDGISLRLILRVGGGGT